ncbi:MAG: hypothetical protein H6752_00570 [Candidatus Omnitrophica bacterium]|nr:hypothetical protein [Candidatus Omnitrophota bacterium]
MRLVVSFFIPAISCLLLSPLFAFAEHDPFSDPFYNDPRIPQQAFANSTRILTGFDLDRENSGWRVGDRALFGILLKTKRHLDVWLVLVEVRSGVLKSGQSISVPRRIGPDKKFDAREWEIGMKGIDGVGGHELKSDSICLSIQLLDPSGKELNQSYAMAPEAFLRKGFFSTTKSANRVAVSVESRGSAQPTDEEKETISKSMGQIVGSLLALFEIVADQRDLKPILKKGMDFPSFLDFLKDWSPTLSMHAHFSDAVTVPWSPSPRQSSRDSLLLPVDVEFNDSTSGISRIQVVDPTPPLDLSAGIVSVDLIHPKKPENKTLVRLLAAKRGTGTPR